MLLSCEHNAAAHCYGSPENVGLDIDGPKNEPDLQNLTIKDKTAGASCVVGQVIEKLSIAENFVK